MIDRLETRFFRTFDAVLQERSFSRAADRLGYVQSTVTTHIRLLEEATGRKLFDRLPRGVEPTEAGRRLGVYASRFLQLGRELEEELLEGGEPRGTVRLRVLESFGAEFLWEPLRSFLEAYPQIDVQVNTGFQADIAEAVRDGQADLGLVPADPGASGLSYEPLLADSLIWAASPAAAAMLERDGWRALEGLRVIGFGPKCMYTAEAEAMLELAGAGRTGMAEFASLDMIKQAVRSGWGVALLPQSGVARELAAGALVECGTLGRRDIRHGLIFSKHREPSRAAGLLCSHLLKSGIKQGMIE